MRIVRGLAAAGVLAVGLIGIPMALVLLGGNPFPTSFSGGEIARALLRPDDGTVLIGLITLIGWLAWLIFAASVLAELISIVTGYRLTIRLPGLGGAQHLAAGLLVTVLAMVVTPQVIQATAGSSTTAATSPLGQRTASSETAPDEPDLSRSLSTPKQSSPAPSAPSRSSALGTPGVLTSDPARIPTARPPAAGVPAAVSLGGTHGESANPKVATHVVESGEDLWSLAERYYGEGREWRKIAAANPQVLSGGPDRLQPGWKLVIPDLDRQPKAVGDSVVVTSGDSLSAIAQRVYGSQNRWDDLFAANRFQVSDPDKIEPGMRLVVPDDATADGAPDADDQPVGRRDDASKNRSVDQLSSETPPEAESPVPEKPEADTPVERKESAATPAPESVRPTPSSPAGSTTASTAASSGDSQGRGARSAAPPTEVAEDAPGLLSESAITVGLASVGGLLAAGLLIGLAVRRRVQLQARPIGRRVIAPPAAAAVAEVVLGRRQRPLSLRTLDLAVRAIAAHALHTNSELPPLTVAKVGVDQIELVMARPTADAPVGFTTSGRSWLLHASDAHYLRTVPGVSEAARPYPALVGIGKDDQDRDVLGDLESMGLLELIGDDPDQVQAALVAIAVELSFSLWADEMILTLVGVGPDLSAALGKHNVNQTADVDGLLDRLEHRAEVQRAHQPEGDLRRNRADPDLADPWAPEIILINQPLLIGQRRRLLELLGGEPKPTIAAVVAGPVSEAHWSYALREQGLGEGEEGTGSTVVGELAPLGLTLTPQLVAGPAAAAIVDLVGVTGSDQTTAAPWWHADIDAPDPAPGNVTYLDQVTRGTWSGGWGSELGDPKGVESVTQSTTAAGLLAEHHPPTLQLLGPIEIFGAAGTTPPRAGKQCLEYCGWLLENPGKTAQAMASALVVAEGTRRSNMSRLRTWLGDSPKGEPYLPDAYSGHIALHSAVSSDWQRLQILTVSGVNRTSTTALRAALELVRGAPLADAAPGQWHWAEELRTDMISAVRDLGVELADRALEANDVDLARWAAARALVAAPGDELLMAARIRTEHQAGNPAETERLTLQLAAHARSLGVDLDSDTVVLLQQVMEGRVRARFA